jgi:hypothetical protein
LRELFHAIHKFFENDFTDANPDADAGYKFRKKINFGRSKMIKLSPIQRKELRPQ